MSPPPPSWSQGLSIAYLYDPNTHGFVALVSPPAGVTLEVAISQPNLSGNGWTGGSFYALTTTDAISPYTQRCNFYPSVLGQDGVRAETLVVTLRRVNTTEFVTATFTPANTPNNTPQAVSLDNTGSGNTGNAPAWAQNLPVGYLYDINTHGFSILVAPGSTSLEVSITQSGSSGNGWTSGTFYPLVTDDPISPYTYRRNFYPTTLGQDGVLSASAVLTFRKAGTNETATVTFTPTNTPGNTPNTLTVAGGSGGTTPPPSNLPPYAQNLNPAYTYNDQNRGFTVYANSGGNQVEVAVSQQYADGQSASGDGWQSESYVALVPQSTQPGYTHKRDFNASTASNGVVTNADVSVLFRQVNAGTSAVAINSFRVVPRNTPGTFPGPLQPYTPPPSPNPTGRPPYPPLSSFVTASVNNNYSVDGVGYVSESTNPNMLDIEFYRDNTDRLEDTFHIRNRRASVVGATELNDSATHEVYYHIDERSWVKADSKDIPQNLRFPVGVPLLVAVWRHVINPPAEERRNDLTSTHGEQRIVVY